MKPNEVLLNARETIRNQDHISIEAFLDDNNCFCTVGAIANAVNPDLIKKGNPILNRDYRLYPEIEKAVNLIGDAMGIEKIKVRFSDMPDYTPWNKVYDKNDSSSKEEVLAYFDKAIELSKETENA